VDTCGLPPPPPPSPAMFATTTGPSPLKYLGRVLYWSPGGGRIIESVREDTNDELDAAAAAPAAAPAPPPRLPPTPD
jgi:hypothetical protein